MSQMRRYLIDPSCIFAESFSDINYMKNRYTVTGKPTQINTPYGKGAQLSVDDSWEIAPADDSSFDLSTFSLSVFLRPTEYTRYPIAKRGTGQGMNMLLFDTDYQLVLIDQSATIKNPGQTLTPSIWQHVGITVEGTVFYSYVNGVPAGPVSINAFTGNVVDPVYVGQRNGTASRYVGGMADMTIWNRAVSPKEMLDLSLGEAF